MDDNCKECMSRIDDVAGAVSRHESRITNLEDRHKTSVDAFSRHMEKEEKSFDNLYRMLRETKDTISSIVMKGMEDRAELKEYFSDKHDTLHATLSDRISKVEQKSVTKESVMLVVVSVGIVFSAIAWLSSHYSAKEITDKQNAQIREMVIELKTEIKKDSGK